MPDIPNRDELEKKLARNLGKLNRVQLMRLMEHLGDPPKIDNVPASFWDETGKELASVLAPFLEEVYVEQSLQLMNNQPIGVDWTLVNEGAVDWANRYSYDLVTNLNETSRRTLQTSVSAYYERGQTIGELEKRLTTAFGPVRAEMIAVTEITRAASEGEQAIARELEKEGIRMIPIWQTNNDELVCPLCGPKHNKPIEDGVYPPAHPRCRCWVNHELPKVEKQ